MVPEHDDLPGDSLNIGDDVGRENNDSVLCQGVNQIAEPYPLPRVQASGRLVQNQQLGVVEHGLGDAHPLAHPAGELPHFLVFRIGQPHQLQQFADSPIGFLPGDTLERGNVAQKLPGGVAGVVAEFLRQIAQQAPIVLVQGADVLTFP